MHASLCTAFEVAGLSGRTHPRFSVHASQEDTRELFHVAIHSAEIRYQPVTKDRHSGSIFLGAAKAFLRAICSANTCKVEAGCARKGGCLIIIHNARTDTRVSACSIRLYYVRNFPRYSSPARRNAECVSSRNILHGINSNQPNRKRRNILPCTCHSSRYSFLS